MRISSLYIAIVFGITLSCFQVAAVKVNHVNNVRLNKRKLNIQKRAGELLGIFSQNGAQTAGSPVNVVQTPGVPAPGGASPAPGGASPAPAPAPGGGSSSGATPPSPPPASDGSSLPPLGSAGTLPSVPALTLPPLPIPALPALPVSLPKSPTLPEIPPLGPLPGLPGSDELNGPNLDIFTPPQD